MKTLKQRAAAAAIAIAAVTGLGLVTAAPAQAITMSWVQKCAWGYKASVQTYNHTGSYTAKAYSETGWLLGTKSGSGNMYWGTPWEDVTIFVSSSDPSYGMSGHCRL